LIKVGGLKKILRLQEKMQIHSKNTCEMASFLGFFLASFILIWGSGQVVGHIFLFFFPELSTIFYDSEKSSNVELILTLAFSPITETAILTYCIFMAKQIFRNKKIAIVCSIAPIAILHALMFWQAAFIVAIPFLFQAIAYTFLRKSYSTFQSMTAIACLHSMANLLTLHLTNSL